MTGSRSAASQPGAPEADTADSIQVAAVSDRPADRDVLGFKPYVDAIARFLLSDNTRPPLTISIEGPWGSGKSSFMRQLELALGVTAAPRRRPLIVKFNAWRHDKDEALWAAFATTFADQLAEQQPWWDRTLARTGLIGGQLKGAGLIRMVSWLALVGVLGIVAVSAFRKAHESLPEIAKLLSGKDNLAQAIAGLGPAAGVVAVVLTALQQATKILGNPLKTSLRKYLRRPDYESRQAFIDIFHRDFKRTIDAFAGDERVFVFVDDLDRCDVPRAADLMQALSMLIADDSRVTFILGMDREKVAAGIAFKFKEVIPYLRTGVTDADKIGEHLRYGHEFLEKFLQIVFPLPSTSPEALQRFVDGLGLVEPPPRRTPWLIRQLRELSADFWGNRRFRHTMEGPASTSAIESAGAATDGAPAAPSIQRQYLTLGFEADSDRIRRIVRGVAPVLGNNPRRIKQFLNLFRLRAYIALETGLLDSYGERRGVTLEQLGKIVALQMRWPAFVEEWRGHPHAMAGLEPGGEQAVPSGWVRWTKEPGLMTLIADTFGGPPEQAKLSAVPVEEVFRVSPAVPRPARTAGGAQTVEATALNLPEGLVALARRYEQIRTNLLPGDERTTLMNGIFEDMRRLGKDVRLDRQTVLKRFPMLSDGERMAVIALLTFASLGGAALGVGLDAIRNSHSGFEQFHALAAARELLPTLDRQQRSELLAAIEASSAKTDGDPSRTGLALLITEEILHGSGQKPFA